MTSLVLTSSISCFGTSTVCRYLWYLPAFIQWRENRITVANDAWISGDDSKDVDARGDRIGKVAIQGKKVPNAIFVVKVTICDSKNLA